MTPRVFAVVFAVLWFVVLFLDGAPNDFLEGLLFAISVAAAYVVALNAAYRAITLSLISAKKS